MNKFDIFLENFRQTPFWRKLLLARDNSFLEENLAEHVRLQISWYDQNLKSNRNLEQQYLTKVSCCIYSLSAQDIFSIAPLVNNKIVLDFVMTNNIDNIYPKYIMQAYYDFKRCNVHGHYHNQKLINEYYLQLNK